MKSVNELYSDLMATLWELETGDFSENKGLGEYLSTKLEILYHILDEEIDESWWDRIENQIDREF